jgi:hypothetical protein
LATDSAQPSRQAEPSVHHLQKACVIEDELQEEEEEDEDEDQEEFEEQEEEDDDEYDDDQPDQAPLPTNQDRQLKRITQIPRRTHLSTSSHTPSLISNDSTGFSSAANQESTIQSSSSFEAHHKHHPSETSTPLSGLQPPSNHPIDSHSSSHSSLSSTLASSPADFNMPTNNRRTSSDSKSASLLIERKKKRNTSRLFPHLSFYFNNNRFSVAIGGWLVRIDED